MAKLRHQFAHALYVHRIGSDSIALERRSNDETVAKSKISRDGLGADPAADADRRRARGGFDRAQFLEICRLSGAGAADNDAICQAAMDSVLHLIDDGARRQWRGVL